MGGKANRFGSSNASTDAKAGCLTRVLLLPRERLFSYSPDAAIRLGGGAFVSLIAIATYNAAFLLFTAQAIAVATPQGDGVANGSVPTANGADGVADIVVTAQKRAERVQDVPLSITALRGAEVERAGIRNILDLTASVPGLRMTNTSGNTAPAIRGITQLTGGTPGTDPSVATYIDGVYQAGEFALNLDLPDISRVEVDKGPQGTLFGRNATGGAVQIFTRDPEFNTHGMVAVTYGRFNDQSVKGFFTTPILAEVLAASISAYEETSDSYYHSLVPSVPTHGLKANLERAKILFTPVPEVRILLEGYYGQHDDAAPEYQTPYNGISIGQNIDGAIVPTKPRDVAGNQELYNNLTLYGGSLHGSVNTVIGDITLLGSYAHAKAPSLTNASNAYIPSPGTGITYYANYPENTKSIEIDFASKNFGGISFVTGLYYFRDSAQFDPLIVTSNLPNAFNYADSIFARQTSTAAAAFGEVTYQVTDKLSIIGGLRYSKEKRETFGGALFSLNPAQPYTNVPSPLPKFGEREPSGVNERVSLRYKVTPQTNAYFTFSTGFRSGSFGVTGVPNSFTGSFVSPAQCAATAGCTFPVYVKPETVKAFEVGLKTKPVDWLTLNLAVFRYDYKNQQISAYQNVNGVPLSILENAAQSQITGGELNIDAALSSEFSLRAGVSALHAMFGNFPNAVANIPAPNNAGTIQRPADASGRQLPFAPKFTSTLTALYKTQTSAGKVTFSADAYYTDKFYFDVVNIYKQSGYVTLGLRASFEPQSIPGLSIDIWGKNVTDRTIAQGAFINANTVGYSYDPPATYGITARFEF